VIVLAPCSKLRLVTSCQTARAIPAGRCRCAVEVRVLDGDERALEHLGVVLVRDQDPSLLSKLARGEPSFATTRVLREECSSRARDVRKIRVGPARTDAPRKNQEMAPSTIHGVRRRFDVAGPFK
jgi:hypothetical protein